MNNGVLRKNEFFKVQETMRTKLGLNLVAVDSSTRFLAKLAGVTDPETKRKIIGNEFISVFDDEAARILRECRNRGAPERRSRRGVVEALCWLELGLAKPRRQAKAPRTTSPGSSREPSTPTSSSPPPSKARRRPSRATTTSEAFPPT